MISLQALIAMTSIPAALTAAAVMAGITESKAKKLREKFANSIDMPPENLYLINKNLFSDFSNVYFISENMLSSIDGNIDSDQLVSVLNGIFHNKDESSSDLIVKKIDFRSAAQEMQEMTAKCFHNQGFPDISDSIEGLKTLHYPEIPQIALITCCFKALMSDQTLLPNVDRDEFGRQYEGLLESLENKFVEKFGNADSVKDFLEHSRNYIKHVDPDKRQGDAADVGVNVNEPRATQLRSRNNNVQQYL